MLIVEIAGQTKTNKTFVVITIFTSMIFLHKWSVVKMRTEESVRLPGSDKDRP